MCTACGVRAAWCLARIIGLRGPDGSTSWDRSGELTREALSAGADLIVRNSRENSENPYVVDGEFIISLVINV